MEEDCFSALRNLEGLAGGEGVGRAGKSTSSYRSPRVFGDKFGDKVGDKFGDSLNLVINLVTMLVTHFVSHQICHNFRWRFFHSFWRLT